MFNVHDNWHELAPSLKLDIDQDRARAIGVTSASVRQTLQAALSGIPLAEFRENDQTIGVVLREPKETRNLLTAVENAYVKTASGAAVPVSQVASVRLAFEPGVEWRRDRLPTITVQGLIPDGLQSPDVTKAIYNQLEPLRNSLPLGYRIEMQGAVEESAKGQASIAAKVPVLVIAILLLLMVQLQSLPKTMLVFATAPLGIIGAAAALLAFQQPFGFVAILGVIALAGIIMRNSVILVDQIKQDIEAGIDAYEAIIGSAVRRFRPIVLTASAAVLALIPLAGSPFWGPMALAIMGGLIAATILTMTFLPALYALAFGVPAGSQPRLEALLRPPAPLSAPRGPRLYTVAFPALTGINSAQGSRKNCCNCEELRPGGRDRDRREDRYLKPRRNTPMSGRSRRCFPPRRSPIDGGPLLYMYTVYESTRRAGLRPGARVVDGGRFAP